MVGYGPNGTLLDGKSQRYYEYCTVRVEFFTHTLTALAIETGLPLLSLHR